MSHLPDITAAERLILFSYLVFYSEYGKYVLGNIALVFQIFSIGNNYELGSAGLTWVRVGLGDLGWAGLGLVLLCVILLYWAGLIRNGVG